MPLSESQIKSAKSKAKPYRLRDAGDPPAVPGLFVRVQPSGIKSFNLAIPGKHSSQSLGKWPSMTLEGARRQAHDRLANGSGPAKLKQIAFTKFLDDEFGPWVKENNKAGAATLANIRAQFGELFKAKKLSEITNWDIEKFKTKRLKAGISRITVNRDLDRIRVALAKGVEWKWLHENPMASVKRLKVEDSTRVRYLSADEERRMRVELGKLDAKAGKKKQPRHLRPLVLLALNTGMRRGELFSLVWENVDLERRQILVPSESAKSGKARYLPLNDEAVAVLKGIGKGKGLVFAGKTGERMTHFKRSWASLVKAAKLEDFHFHDCRHHFASRLVMAQVDLYAVQTLLGHSDSKMTQRYAHLDPEHMRAAVAKLSVVRN